MANKFTLRLASLSVILIVLTLRLQAQIPASNKPVVSQTQVSGHNDPGSVRDGYTIKGSLNYVKVRTGVNGISSEAEFDGKNFQQVKQSTQYMDGLGRLLQTVDRQAGVGDNPRDMVTPVLYDELGREAIKYLPYVQSRNATNDGEFKMDPFKDQAHFYNSIYKDADGRVMYAGEQYLYGKTNFEASPLNRVKLSMAPGNSWTGSEKGIEQKYLVNTEADGVRIWNITSTVIPCDNPDQNMSSFNIPTTTSIYNNGKLYKNVSVDENGKAVVEYKDLEGKVILKKVQIDNSINNTPNYAGYDGWLCTYYVYDDLGLLRFVIPPKAVQELKKPEVNWNLAIPQSLIEELCFRYEYDDRQRMISKKVPGSGWVQMVYDTRDRLVYTQDANMRVKHQWLKTGYDLLNRPVMTSMMTATEKICRDFLQGDVNSVGYYNDDPGGPPDPDNGPTPEFFVRDVAKAEYVASESITFITGFSTEPGDEFVARIADGGSLNSMVASTNLVETLPGVTLTPLTITHYDDYENKPHSYDDAYNSKLNVTYDPLSPTNIIFPEGLLYSPAQQTVRTKGMVTWTKVRVLSDPTNLGSGQWLSTTMFYDHKGRVIQTHSDNYQGGKDIVSNRYDFVGKVLCNYLDHTNPQAIANQAIRIKTLMKYDHAGRLAQVSKIINDQTGDPVVIANNIYDELGQLKTKQLGRERDANGAYTPNPIESLDYTYNIRGWLKGINASYSHPELVGGVDKDRWFGMELNYDWGNENSLRNQLNGNIGSITWKSKSNGTRRAYGYSYDPANRLLSADFSEFSSGGYMDVSLGNFDVKMGDGVTPSSAYDANGNIMGMTQYGKLQNDNPIDILTYQYLPNSNKLQLVNDPTPRETGQTGDFKDVAGDDYGYDRNGNLITDKNKSINTANAAIGKDLELGGAIVYNHLNLPYQITVAGKGTITYMYDAAGNKLEKRVQETNPVKNTKTSYVAGMVYENDELQFISHEEGRLRIKTEGSVTTYNYDYFIKDHLGNVRMMLTDEDFAPQLYQATMETERKDEEVAEFGEKINSTKTSKSAHPGFDKDSENKMIAAVNGSSPESSVGPGLVLKVKAGDKINARCFAWYSAEGDRTSNKKSVQNVASTLLSQLVGGLGAAGKELASGAGGMQGLNADLAKFMNSQENERADRPKAYLNWVAFDGEKLAKVDDNSGFRAVPSADEMEGEGKQALIGDMIEIKKSGYIYVFVNNESRQNVYFDELTIQHTQGPLLEETHYYPFGLEMQGINSNGALSVKNRSRFNGVELSSDLDININEMPFRSYDNQTGRFWQLDPLASIVTHQSPFTFGNSNPIFFSDEWGLLSDSVNRDVLPNFTVYARPKPKEGGFGGFYFPARSRNGINAYRREKYEYDRRRSLGENIVQGGESELYLQNVNSFGNRFKAEEDGRRMTLGSVVLLASPVLVMAAPSVIAETQLATALISTEITEASIALNYSTQLALNAARTAGIRAAISVPAIAKSTVLSNMLNNALKTPVDVSARTIFVNLRTVLTTFGLFEGKVLPNNDTLFPREQK